MLGARVIQFPGNHIGMSIAFTPLRSQPPLLLDSPDTCLHVELVSPDGT